MDTRNLRGMGFARSICNTNAKLAIKSKGDIFMIDKDDWRLRGQEDYLSGKALYFRKWKAPRKNGITIIANFVGRNFPIIPTHYMRDIRQKIITIGYVLLVTMISKKCSNGKKMIVNNS